MDENLRFRRQFLLTRTAINAPADWKCLTIDEYYLYAHPDLEVTRSADPKKSIVLIGNIYDFAEPEKGNADILKDILASANSIEGFVSRIKRYAGRYALLYKDDKDAFILPDALALREVYYCTKNNQIVCGSQPNLIAKFSNPEAKPSSDTDLLDFYRNYLKASEWIGDETYYEDVKHLLPNHYLDINKREARRYWPNEPIKRLDLDEAVSRSCTILQGNLRAMAHRHSVMMAVTSGMDSRTLLAASRGSKEKIYYFINNQGMSHSHPDISVPRKIFESIGSPFHVHDVAMDVDDEFRRIFLSNAFFATERILPTIYNVYFKHLSEKINILGLGELCRTYYGKVPRNLNSYYLAYKLNYKDCRYVIRQCEQMLIEMLPVAKKFRINMLTLLYWEQRAGNWGAVGNSESDIAMEEVDPYGCHLLCEVLLGVDENYRRCNNSVLFREMILNMWPELLEWPINPPHSIKEKVAWFLSKVNIYKLFKELKYQVNYVRYLFTAQLS